MLNYLGVNALWGRGTQPVPPASKSGSAQYREPVVLSGREEDVMETARTAAASPPPKPQPMVAPSPIPTNETSMQGASYSFDPFLDLVLQKHENGLSQEDADKYTQVRVWKILRVFWSLMSFVDSSTFGCKE